MRSSDWSSDVCSSDLASWLSIFWFASAACSRATRSSAAISGRRIAGSRRNISPPLPRCHRADEPVREGEERRKRAALAHQHLRSEEHTSELQSLMRISYAVFCLKKKKKNKNITYT